RLWVGEREATGKVSLYHGPVLLAYDTRFGPHDAEHPPVVDVARPPQVIEGRGAHTPAPQPFLLMDFATEDGGRLRLCDFASAGAAGNRYASWLPANGQVPTPFRREDPLRAVWPNGAE